MKTVLPDLDTFERVVFKRKNALSLLLSFSLKLLRPRHVGLLYGTDKTNVTYLAPEKWDRGVMHKFNGAGFSGFILKLFGRWIVRFKGLSPVRLFKETSLGDRLENDGVISYVLRKHREFYGRGIKILIIDIPSTAHSNIGEAYSNVSVLSYNGNRFRTIDDLKMNNAIARQFRSKNFVSAYVPDYGAIVFNTISEELLQKTNGKPMCNADFKKRLDTLISAIEMASLAHIGRAKGKQAAHIIWHKEKNLRRTAFQLQQKEIELEAQRQYLRAVGAVTEKQLNMEAINIPDGVYAFMDMVGSATIRKNFIPRDYFFILNLCHQIAADNAARFTCRVDNFMGDCVFIQNASPFDARNCPSASGLQERLMLMIFAISSVVNQIHLLKTGRHPLDSDGVAKKLIEQAGSYLGFRAGIEIGPAMIGPLGSQKRKIVTAIGKSVNNASRLESSGVQEQIHISEPVMEILENAIISKDTQLLWQIVSPHLNFHGREMRSNIKFFSAYRHYFNLKAPVFVERKNVSYKEFFSTKTYLLRCVPE